MEPWNKGKTGIYSKESLAKMSAAASLKTGEKNSFYGRRHSPEVINLISGSNNSQWKGDDVGYAALHDWLEKHLPKPDKCPRCQLPAECKECKRTIRLEIANITGIYKRNLENWQWLCVKCHRAFDKYPHDPLTGRFIKKGTKPRQS